MLSVRTNPSTLAAGLGAVKNELRKLTDLRVNLAHPMYRESQAIIDKAAEVSCESKTVQRRRGRRATRIIFTFISTQLLLCRQYPPRPP